MTTDPFKEATAAAIKDIHAALGGTDQTDAVTSEAEPAPPSAEQLAAAASGAAVAHGNIRLRDQLPGPSAPLATTVPKPDPAAAEVPGHGALRLRAQPPASEAAVAGPVGHGIIRLYDPTTTPEPTAASAASHGVIHLHGRTAPPEPGRLHAAIAEPIEPEDPDTEAAREDILAAIAATS